MFTLLLSKQSLSNCVPWITFIPGGFKVVFLQSGAVVRRVWDMIHTVATPKCHNAVGIFKALRRSAVKDLITSVNQASPRPFSLTTKSPYSFLECWCPQKPVRVWGHHTLLCDLTLSLGSQYYWDAFGTGSSPTCLISHIKLVQSWAKARPPDTIR